MSANQQKGAESSTKKRSKTFLIVLVLLLVAGAWFGISKYNYASHHEDTDDAQVEANISRLYQNFRVCNRSKAQRKPTGSKRRHITVATTAILR